MQAQFQSRKNIVSFSLLLIIFMGMQAKAQEFKKHQWKDRIVVLLSAKANGPLISEQLQTLDVNDKEFKERKLVVYQVTPEKYRLVTEEREHWSESQSLYRKLNPENHKFKVLLIGLDGSIKLEQPSILMKQTLFETIDAMPMRRAEMRKNQGR